MNNKNIRIALLIIFIPTVLVIFFLTLKDDLIAWTGCCTPSSEFTGVVWDGCCVSGGNVCCSPQDAINSGCEGVIPCENCCGNGTLDAGEECDGDLGNCGANKFCNDDCECEQKEDPCVLCDLAQCPNPPLSDTVSPYILDDFYSCTDSESCPNPRIHYRDCYEVPTNQPDVYFTLHPETNDPTTRGFQSLTHTGAGIEDDEVNEPVRMRAIFIDPDNPTNPSDIETLYIWFSTGTRPPYSPRYIDLDNNSGQAARTAANTSYGFLMHKEGGSWVPYVPSLIGSPSGDKWVRAAYVDNEFSIKGANGTTLVNIYINSVGEAPRGFPVMGQEVDFNIFFNTNNPVPDGLYNIFGMANKTFGFTPYDNYEPYVNGITYPDVAAVIHDIWGPEEIRYYNQWVDTVNDWNVDLHSPSITSYTYEVTGQTKITFSWTITDNLALYGIVGNLYIDENFKDVEEFDTTVSSGGTIDVNTPYTPHVLLPENIPGHLQNDYLFRILGNDGTGSTTIDVNGNRHGIIYLYLTGFDRGGNLTASDYISFDLRDWMATQGGLLFSREGIDVTSRTIDEDLWDPVALINKFNPITVDVSSELETDSVEGFPTAPDKSDVIDTYMVRPYVITDLESYYTILRNSFERKKSGLLLHKLNENTSLLVGNLVGNNSPNIRYLDKTSGDLTVGTTYSPFVCNGKGVFFVSENLIINGKILNGNTTPNRDACIFVVKGNVIVKEGANSSPSTIGYDPLNAYILADGTFIIEAEKVTKPIPDGLYVGGGIHSLDGLTLYRYLKLDHRLQFPVFVVDHHSKYGVFAGQIFGSQVNMQKVEVGIKP